MNRVAVTANCGTSPLPSFPSHVHICLLTFSFPFPFCFKHGRVNLLILQAASLSIYLFSCFSPPPPFYLTPSLRQGCAVRLFQSSGVVRSDGWLSTFCCLPLRSWEIYRLADYQAWKPISLSHSSHPSFIHAFLAPSISLRLFQHLPCTKKKKRASIIERCVQNNIEICVWTEESNWSSWGLLWMCQRGKASSEWYPWSLTAHLAHPHLFHCSQLLHESVKQKQIHPCSPSWWQFHFAINKFTEERSWANCRLKIWIWNFITATIFGNFTRLGPHRKLATHEEHIKSHTGSATLTTVSAANEAVCCHNYQQIKQNMICPKILPHKKNHPRPLHQTKVRKYTPSPVTSPWPFQLWYHSHK